MTRFTLLEQRGHGGMGVVWRARDEETGEIVALKLIRDAYDADSGYLARFAREAELAQRVRSEHVVGVLASGVREGVPYLALEYVDGPSLRERLENQGPYGWPEGRELLRQLAAGLADVHAAGILHRDIKPSNILLAPDGKAKLTDFGIARGLDLTRVTGPSTLLGTPAYLPPEGFLDARSDLYSLGCVAYELLTGMLPFEGPTYQEMILQRLQGTPDLSRLPPEARPIVGALLARDPAGRPRSAAELENWLAGTFPARPASGAAPPRAASASVTSRRRGAFLGAVALAVALLLAVGAELTAHPRASPAPAPLEASPTLAVLGTAVPSPAGGIPAVSPPAASPSVGATVIVPMAPGPTAGTRPTAIPTPTADTRPTAIPTPVQKSRPTPSPTVLSFIATVGSLGHRGLTQFDGPFGIATDRTYLYVSDEYNSRVVKLRTSDLAYVAAVGTEGTGPDQFDGPFGIATDGTFVYVADPNNHRIVTLRASDLSLVAAVGFSLAWGLATDGTFVYVADYSHSRVVKLRASDLSFVASVGTDGSGPDQFKSPMGIATDGTYVYVADTFNDRIEKRLASDLSLVATVGAHGSGPDQFNSPIGIATDGTSVYVGDSLNDRVEKRSASDLSLVATVGALGSGSGQFSYPEGVVSNGPYLFVVDSHNDRVVKLWAGE